MATKKMVFKLIIVGLGIFLLIAPATAAETQYSKNKRDMQSYAMGVEMLKDFNRQGFDFDLDMVTKGMKDAAAGGKLLWSEEVLTSVHRMAVAELRYKKGQARIMAQEDNRKAGEQFLAENKTKEGIMVLPSGLQYRILKAGDGMKPTDADTVEFRYRGTHIDGTELENSGSSGTLTTLKKVSEVLPGWREALKLMSAGSKWQVFIPSELAYGQRGAGKIGPYETTIYEIELIAIK
jgi:FKBP-type peptidyl-prolyl cis-trans isomerase FklB